MTEAPREDRRRRVIINADDLGLSAGVDRGILEGFRTGVLTSTTMLVNMDGFDDAVRLAHDNPDLPVGIHLTLLWGRPVSPPKDVPTLVERDGSFPLRAGPLARRMMLGRIDPAHIRLELAAQIRRFRDAGLEPTHVDTHKHVHCLPGVMRALAAVAAELGIRKVRLPVEHGPLGPAPAAARARRHLVRFLCRGHRRILEAHGLRTTDHFAGIAQTGSLCSEGLRGILRNASAGVTEVMCHPGYADHDSGRWSSRPLDREGELRSLQDDGVRREIAEQKIDLISYRDLDPVAASTDPAPTDNGPRQEP